ncbi:MAG: response regulator [Sneathiella sp.]
MRLLLVEDDLNLGSATTDGLRDVFAVDWVMNAEEAEEALLTVDYSMIVLDINLPGMSGLDLLDHLRRDKNQIPVLLLTSRDAVHHRIEGLNTGADDYLVKPFDLDELLARCAALIRRSDGNGTPQISVRGIRFEPASGLVEVEGKSILLTAREQAILNCLMRNLDRPVSKDRIRENIYDWSSDDAESNTIEVHVASLRRKLGKELIKTIRGIGYVIIK